MMIFMGHIILVTWQHNTQHIILTTQAEIGSFYCSERIFYFPFHSKHLNHFLVDNWWMICWLLHSRVLPANEISRAFVFCNTYASLHGWWMVSRCWALHLGYAIFATLKCQGRLRTRYSKYFIFQGMWSIPVAILLLFMWWRKTHLNNLILNFFLNSPILFFCLTVKVLTEASRSTSR